MLQRSQTLVRELRLSAWRRASFGFVVLILVSCGSGSPENGRRQLVNGNCSEAKNVRSISSSSCARHYDLPDTSRLSGNFRVLRSIVQGRVDVLATEAVAVRERTVELDASDFLEFVGDKELSDSQLDVLVTVPKLISIKLVQCELITDAGIANLAGLVGLKAVYMVGCQKVSDVGISLLLSLETIEVLDFALTRVKDRTIIGSLAQRSSLRHFGVAMSEELSDDAVNRLCEVTTLEELDMWGAVGVTDNGLKAVCQLPKLRWLNLRSCPLVTARGLDSLANLPGLMWCNLGGTQADDTTCLALATGCKEMQVLSLANCSNITGKGVEHMRRLKKLKTLDLRGCTRIAHEAIDELKNANSDLLVYR